MDETELTAGKGVACPRCKGKGEVDLLTGMPHDRSLIKEFVAHYCKENKLVAKRVEGCHLIVVCQVCSGSGAVIVTPAAIKK